MDEPMRPINEILEAPRSTLTEKERHAASRVGKWLRKGMPLPLALAAQRAAWAPPAIKDQLLIGDQVYRVAAVTPASCRVTLEYLGQAVPR